MGLRRTVAPELADASVALERARALLAADLFRLDLPSPSVTINELGLAPAAEEPFALDVLPVDRVLCARVITGELPLTVCLPMSGGLVLPAEIVGRLDVAAPATALLTPHGWRAHPLQVDDPVAQAFLQALGDKGDLDEPLAWGPPDLDGEDWAIQVVADQADSCLLVVRTAPLGEQQGRAGIEAFLDIMPILRHMMRRWNQQVALPVGPTRECLSLQELPPGEAWEPDWTHREDRVFRPEDLEEEDFDEISTVLALAPPMVNLAEVDLTDSGEPVTFDGPVVEVFDDEGFEEVDEEGSYEAIEAILVVPGEVEPAAVEPAAVESAAVEPQAPASVVAPAATGPRPGLAAAASLLLPGVGQIMCGQVAKGVLVMSVAVVTLGLGGLLNLAMAIDAWTVANKLREGGHVRRWSFFG